MEKLKLLLVEDNPGDVRLIKELLRDTPEANFDLHSAPTIYEALTLLSAQDFDAILLDLSLPDSKGLDTLQAIRDCVPHTATVVLTGSHDQELGVQAVQGGAQDYLIKGEGDARLITRAVRYAIERQQLADALLRREQEYSSLINDVFDTSMVAVLILDRALQVVWCNEATELYFGFKREEVINQDKRKLIDDKLKCVFADPDDYMTKLISAYDAESFTDRFECHVTPGDGREDRWLEHWSQPIRDGIYRGGRIEQYTDVTDRKRYEIAEREQRQFAEALRDTAAMLTSTLDLNEVLDRILENVDRVVPHDAANIMLLDGDRVFVARQRNDGSRKMSTQDIRLGGAIPLRQVPVLEQIIGARTPVFLPDTHGVAGAPIVNEQERRRAYAGVPIVLQDQIIGFINIFNDEPNSIDERDIERLSTFAGQAAIALDNARLYSKSQELATVEERQRLARELHDSVSQTLFTASAMAESALRQWVVDPIKARNLMEEVHQLSLGALAEMRLLLLELRPAALARTSITQLLKQYLEPIRSRRGLAMVLDVSDDLPLEPDMKLLVYRIVQEALNNIDKHAQAAQVTIRLQQQGEQLLLTIQDDGRGFDAAAVTGTSLGLGIMRERAEAAGGTLTLDSVIGRGTTIQVTIPNRGAKG
jgi:PAS domain S-box-containing protein